MYVTAREQVTENKIIVWKHNTERRSIRNRIVQLNTRSEDGSVLKELDVAPLSMELSGFGS